MNAPPWLKRVPLRQLCRGLLLPLLMLLAQQGALLHELGHYAGPDVAARKSGQHPQQAGHCDLCLAYAPVGSAAAPAAAAAPQLLAGLRHERRAIVADARESAASLTPRSRGPPTAL